MQGKVHVAIGCATAACLAVKYPTGLDIMGMNILPTISLIAATAGSYAPDIDMGRTHSGMKHKTASKVISKVGGGHRGITHTLLVPVVVAAFMWFINGYLTGLPYITSFILSLCFGWEWGYLMHLFADMFNGKGIPLFWPLLRTKVHIMDLPSSGFVPWLFTIIFVVVFGYIIFGGFLG